MDLDSTWQKFSSVLGYVLHHSMKYDQINIHNPVLGLC